MRAFRGDKVKDGIKPITPEQEKLRGKKLVATPNGKEIMKKFMERKDK